MSRTRTRTRTAALVAIALAPLLLGACGDEDDSATTSTTAPADPAAGDGPDADADGGADEDDGEAGAEGAVPDACTLVEPAEVEALVGDATGTEERDVALDGLEYSQCTWENEESMLIVAVVGGPERHEMHQDTLPGDPLEGVGDQAITAPGVSSETTGATGGRTISALVDDRTLVVALKVPGQTTVDLVAPIATTVADRLAG